MDDLNILRIGLEDEFPRGLSEAIIASPTIYDLIFDACSPAVLLRFSRTCKAATIAVRSYIRRALNINRLLSRYFDDPVAFRSIQASTGTLISGSTAVQFLGRWFYPDSDLDLYVPMRHSRKLGKWLMDAGYVFSPNTVQDADFFTELLKMVESHERNSLSTSKVNTGMVYRMPGVAAIFNFLKAVGPGSPDFLKVQIIASLNSPIACIFDFHCSE